MTRPTLTSILLRSVSCKALDSGVSSLEFLSPDVERSEAGLGFLARIRLWLRLVFGGVFGSAVTVHALPSEPRLNRRGERRAKRKFALAHSTFALGHILLRDYGYSRFLQWLCDFTLLSRIERCFLSRRRFWMARKGVSACEEVAKINVICGAPLCPD